MDNYGDNDYCTDDATNFNNVFKYNCKPHLVIRNSTGGYLGIKAILVKITMMKTMIIMFITITENRWY